VQNRKIEKRLRRNGHQQRQGKQRLCMRRYGGWRAGVTPNVAPAHRLTTHNDEFLSRFVSALVVISRLWSRMAAAQPRETRRGFRLTTQRLSPSEAHDLAQANRILHTAIHADRPLTVLPAGGASVVGRVSCLRPLL
jgi:hypothetical protein